MGSMSDDEEPSSAPDDTADHEGAEGEDHENEELLRKLQSRERQARTHWSKWRQEARRCYAFVSGDQWSADDKAALLEQMRVPITFNRTSPMIDAVTGAEVLNRQEVSYSPREMGDVQVSEIVSGAAKWARQQCDAEDEESDAFSDTVVCGMGWTETRMDYESDPEGLIVVDRVDPLEMFSDPAATKRNVADARWIYRARYRDKDELPPEWRRKISDAGDQDGDQGFMDQGQAGSGDDYEEGEQETAGKEPDRKKVWIRHHQWWELEDGFKLADPATGQIAVMSPDEFKAAVTMFLQNGLQPPEAAKIKVRRYMQAFVAGNTVLETGPVPCNQFTFKCITGKRDRNSGTFYGIVRAMIDPQMWANKWLSQILHILNTSAKGGVMMEKDSVENPRKFMEEWAKPDGIIEVKTGALARGAIQEREAKNWPQGLSQLLEFAVGSMPQVTGINLEMLGLVQKEQAGVLEAQRKQAGYAILAVFFDSLRRYRKMQGRLMLHYIQEYLSDGRLIRISGDQGQTQYVPLVRDKTAGTYDVIVDEAPMSANQKEAVWGMFVQLMPVLMKQPIPGEMWAEFLRFSPLPSSVSQKLAQMVVQASQPDPQAQQMQQAMGQLEIQGKAAEVAVDQTNAQLNQARAVQAMSPPEPPQVPM